MPWPKNRSEFGPNHTPALIGLSSLNEEDIIPVAVDPTTGAILVEATFSGTITTAPTFSLNPGAPTPTPAFGLVDSSFREVVVGAGTAGTPAGGILSIQGVSGGTAIPVTISDSTGSATVVGNLTNNNAAPTNNNLGVLPAIASINGPEYTNGDQVLLSTDLFGNLRTTQPAVSILGDITTATRNNQVEVNFSQPSFDAGNIINSTSGSGSATQANGEGVYATGTTGTGEATGVTAQVLLYRPGSEAFAYFTGAFTTPTDSTNVNYQRIGPYISTDGFYISYEKNVFGATIRQNSVNTFVAQANWNVDTLTGAATSHFTRNGVPEALIQTDLNLFRIRWSWFGTAPILFEVLSPDGVWVLFHNVRHPNTSPLPSIFQSNLNITIDVKKTSSDATNLIILTSCMAGGMSNPFTKISDPVTNNSLVELGRSVITGQNPGGTYSNVALSNDNALEVSGSGDVTNSAVTWTTATAGNTTLAIVTNLFNYNTVGVQLLGSGTITTGKITFEVSTDGTNWAAIPGTNVSTQTNQPVAYVLTSAVVDLTFNITGFNYFRARLSTAITGAGGQVIISFVLQALATPNATLLLSPLSSLTANQGTPNTATNGWPVKLTDGTNTTTVIAGSANNGPAVGTVNSAINIGQTTSNSTQVQLTSSSIVPVNGIIVQALSTNTASVFIGATGVTTSTGFELQAGQPMAITPSNANLIYIIGSNNTDKVCWNVL